MMTRRCAGVALGFFAVVPAFMRVAGAQNSDTAAVEQAVEALRRLMLQPNAAALEALLADQLSYGHSDGRVQNRTEFVDSLMTGASKFNAIALSDQTISVVDDIAVVRHVFAADVVSNGKPGQPRIRILQVWQKRDGRWRLLARQAH